MTGQTERPSRSPPENRKAKASPPRNAKAALLGLHRAEQQLLLASQSAERKATLQRLRAQAAVERTIARQAITDKYVRMIAAMPAALAPTERTAMLARLRLEEASEVAQLTQALAQQQAKASRGAMLDLAQRHRAQRAGLRVSQRRQRAVAAAAWVPATIRRGTSSAAVTSTRSVALRPRRAGT